MRGSHLPVHPVTFLALIISAFFVVGSAAVTSTPAHAVVYCQYVDYPPSCVARAGVVLRPRPVARAVATPGVGAPVLDCGPEHRPTAVVR